MTAESDGARSIFGVDESGFVAVQRLAVLYRTGQEDFLRRLGSTPGLVVERDGGSAVEEGDISYHSTCDGSEQRSALASQGEYAGSVALLTKRPGNPFPDMFTIGRARNCDITCNRAGISKIHAYFLRQDEGWSLLDLDSRNGTYIDGERLSPSKKHPVSDGAQIRFGHDLQTRLLLPDSLILRLERE